jgi:hypothetical protein
LEDDDFPPIHTTSGEDGTRHEHGHAGHREHDIEPSPSHAVHLVGASSSGRYSATIGVANHDRSSLEASGCLFAVLLLLRVVVQIVRDRD